jgi:hypothetical protein
MRDWGSWLSCAPFVDTPSYSLDSLHQETSSWTNLIHQSTSSSHLQTPPNDDQLSSSPDDSFSIPYPNWNAPMDLPNLITVETKYNPMEEKNMKVIFKRMDTENRWRVTERERGYAKKCKYPKNLQDFSSQVCFLFLRKKLVSLKYDQLKNQLTKGFKSGRTKYLYFSSGWLERYLFL